ncbi:MAG: protein-tyrosine phosphatase [Actinomycetota bacterium]|jgi:protein-tyrosine-phosphatase
MAEGILRHRAQAAGLDVHVSSAGVLPGGSPPTDHAVAVCAERDIDISSHVSRRLERPLVEEADLVIVMAREHLREAVVASPAAFAKTFTLRELVRRIDANPRATLAELHAGRQIGDYVKADPADDVADPVGMSRAKYEDTVWELDGLLTRVVLWLRNLTNEPRQVAS